MDDTPTKPPRDPSPADDPHDDDTIPNEEHPENEGRAAEDDQRPRYRSWKKKWRKLRVTFDHKMHEAEVLWMQEQKAKATIKRIAVENDRLIDLLSDINASSQIPLEKRITVPTSPPRSSPTSPQPQKTLAALESEVPHMTLDKAKESIPDFLHDVTPAPGEDAPAPFLTVDELENYLLEVDQRIGLPKLATLAPASKEPAPGAATSATRDFLLRHPHSAYNWLKINAPHVFLQGDDEDGKKGRGEKGKGGGGARGGKRGKAAREKEEREAGEMSVDEEGGDGQRKRKRDEGDAGYRPKGGSGARPAKRKRKSEGEVKRRRTAGEKAE